MDNNEMDQIQKFIGAMEDRFEQRLSETEARLTARLDRLEERVSRLEDR